MLKSETILCDKNGKELEDGDIIKSKVYEIGYVYFSKLNLAWMIKHSDSYKYNNSYLMSMVDNEFEIVGKMPFDEHLMEEESCQKDQVTLE